MLRDKNLIPLSHQHQRALALCVRIDRAAPIPASDMAAWQAEVAQEFKSEISIHFAAEERILFPLARGFKELESLVEELLREHAELRARFARASELRLSSAELKQFAQMLSTHIRKEERQLFELLQQLANPSQMTELGNHLNRALSEAEHSCALPDKAKQLRASR